MEIKTGAAAPRRLGYLSGGPRVSTHPAAEARGPRSHVLGVISGFRSLGWEVASYILGDRVPRAMRNSEQRLVSRRAAALAADLTRLALRPVNAQTAWRELGRRVDWVYERLTSFQAVGMPFRNAGIPWLLETNALLYEEATIERKTVVLSSCARRLEIQAYQRCDVVVCISGALKEAVTRQANIPTEKVLVIPNGVDTELFDPSRHSSPRLFPEFKVVFAGSLAPWQGLDLLLHALADARRELALPISLVIAGDGPSRLEIEGLARSLDLGDGVRFLGKIPQEDVPALIASGDVTYSGHTDLAGGRVFRSPLKLYEYMSMGTPVIASAMDDARALIGDDRLGFLFRPGDLNDLKRALSKAFMARPHLPAIGRAGRAEIVRFHSWTARTRSIVEGTMRIIGAVPP